jgi:hypothetical protein
MEAAEKTRTLTINEIENFAPAEAVVGSSAFLSVLNADLSLFHSVKFYPATIKTTTAKGTYKLGARVMFFPTAQVKSMLQNVEPVCVFLNYNEEKGKCFPSLNHRVGTTEPKVYEANVLVSWIPEDKRKSPEAGIKSVVWAWCKRINPVEETIEFQSI